MRLKYVVLIVSVSIVISVAVFTVVIQNQPESDIFYESTRQDDDKFDPVSSLSFHDTINAFAFDLFRVLHEENEGNLFISPYSIFTALAMIYEGARGETSDEMANILSIEQDNESFHSYMKNLYEFLDTKNAMYNVSTANALWIKENLQLLEIYLSIIQEYYSGDITEVDYSNPPEAAQIINQWIENQTNGLIQDLIIEETIDPLTTLMLTNTIYFKGIWKNQFDPVNTINRTFTTREGTSVEVPTMSILDTENAFYYTETDDLQILELPYTGKDISMVILLPRHDNLSFIINSIDNEMFSAWTESMVETGVDVYLPKFTVENSFKLKKHLNVLGMDISFTPYADFSGITGGRDLFISQVLHKSFIDVNEEGTEAVSATSVNTKIPTDESDNIMFNVNHPFIFLIRHIDTGTILFMGEICNPQL